MKRIYLSSLGCAKNQVDAELMLGAARADGHTVVDSPEDADVLVVNTCAFIDQARETSIEEILRLARIKADAAGKRLVVTGCLAQRYAGELAESLPEVDAMVGTGALDRFGEALEATGGQAYIAGSHYLPAADMQRHLLDRDGSAFLKVSEGCDHECSFCVIPAIRGRHRSRPLDDVAAEAERLAAAGVVELNVIAQDLSAYGRDLGEREGLAALLYRLGRVGSIERVRCHYLYPSTLSDAALEAMARVENVCAYVDLPLQHADPGVLQRMRRARDTDQLRRLLDRVRARLDDPTVRTAFIVGFPGEDDAAFERLTDFLAEQRFDRVGVFRYSPEEGSAAAALGGAVPRSVAEKRADRLRALQERISAERLARHVGAVQGVLVCGREEDGQWFGRTEGQSPEIDGVTHLGDETSLEGAASARAASLVGRILPVRITGSDACDLFGEPSPAP